MRIATTLVWTVVAGLTVAWPVRAAEPAAVKPADDKPAADKPAALLPAAAPAETKPAEAKPGDVKPAGSEAENWFAKGREALFQGKVGRGHRVAQQGRRRRQDQDQLPAGAGPGVPLCGQGRAGHCEPGGDPQDGAGPRRGRPDARRAVHGRQALEGRGAGARSALEVSPRLSHLSHAGRGPEQPGRPRQGAEVVRRGPQAQPPERLGPLPTGQPLPGVELLRPGRRFLSRGLAFGTRQPGAPLQARLGLFQPAELLRCDQRADDQVRLAGHDRRRVVPDRRRARSQGRLPLRRRIRPSTRSPRRLPTASRTGRTSTSSAPRSISTPAAMPRPTRCSPRSARP